MFGNPMELLILAGAAVLLFGADKVPKLARGLGQAKAEFMAGQTEMTADLDRKRAETPAAPPTETSH